MPTTLYTIRVAGTPKAQPRPRAVARGGFARVYNPDTADEWKAAVAAAPSTPAKPSAPIESAVKLGIVVRMPIPKSRAKHVETDSPHTFKPDLDNLAKAIFDAMTNAGWWKDDCQISHLTVSKVWSDEPGAIIEVYV